MLQQASQQVLASEARRQQLEAADQVRVLRPQHSFSCGPGSQPGAAQAFLPLPPQKVGAGLSEMEKQIRESRTSLEKDIKALSELLARLGKETPRPGPGPLGPRCISRIFLGDPVLGKLAS